MVLRWLIKIIYHTINEISGTIDLCGALWRKFKEAVETILELLYWEIKVDTVTVPKQFWKYYREVFNYEYKIYCLIYIIFIIIYLYLCYKKMIISHISYFFLIMGDLCYSMILVLYNKIKNLFKIPWNVYMYTNYYNNLYLLPYLYCKLRIKV